MFCPYTTLSKKSPDPGFVGVTIADVGLFEQLLKASVIVIKPNSIKCQILVFIFAIY
jgi:hypothetical protein